jgi:uncharacterized protein involved in exopolysaccharide biosynthesis
MNQHENIPSSATGDAGVAGFARVLRRQRRMVYLLTFGLPLIAAIIMLFTANKFTAHGTVLVETPEGGFGSDLMTQLTAVAGLPGQVPPTEMYRVILESERVALAVADSLDLAAHYEIEADSPEERVEKTLRKLRKRVEFQTPDLVSIQVSAKDKSPRMAARMVNTFLLELEQASQTLALSRARRTRALVETALEETKAELDSTRLELQGFQETHGVFSIDKQTEGTLELIAELQAQLLAAKTERDALDSFTSEGAGGIRSLDFKIEALEVQIGRLLGRLDVDDARIERTPAAGKPTESFFIPLNALPGLAGEYARIFMDLKVQEAKYNVLATQLEQTKIEESQSIPAFEILDWARVPHRKSSPRRTLTVLAAFFGGLLASLLFAVLVDDLDRRVDDGARRELGGLLPRFLRGRLGRRERETG